MKRTKRIVHGGKRRGAGRPVGSGPGPNPNARHNRVQVSVSDAELAVLQEVADDSGDPLAAVAYGMMVSGGMVSHE